MEHYTLTAQDPKQWGFGKIRGCGSRGWSLEAGGLEAGGLEAGGLEAGV